MSNNIHQQNKKQIGKLRAALYNIEERKLKDQLNEIYTPDCEIHLAFPFEDLHGPKELYEQAYKPLLVAIPDLERRDFILMAGHANKRDWVGCAGYYTGVFEKHWLDIPPTQHAIAFRYHEFFCLEDSRIVEMQALWDIPQVMMQAQAWPMTPSLGVEWVIPGPATQDGIITTTYNQSKADESVQLVQDMLDGLQKSPEGVEAMTLDRFWHPKMNWYGPAGIGTSRQISGFRNWHQIPFLKGMPDRQAILDNGYLFGDEDYVAFTAWPGMYMTISGDGWLGIAPANKKITMRSLDFWAL
jgi:predicted ester cyclase